MILERSAFPAEPITQQLVVTCCAPIGNNPDTLLYAGMHSAAQIQAKLEPLSAINITATKSKLLHF